MSTKLRNNNQRNASVRDSSEPAGTLYFAKAMNDVRWITSPTITAGPGGKGSPRNVTGGAHARHSMDASAAAWGLGESVAITVEEASILQSFRPDYPWQGSKTKKFEQIGNAIPPRLAAHIIGALLGLEVSFEDSAEELAG